MAHNIYYGYRAFTLPSRLHFVFLASRLVPRLLHLFLVIYTRHTACYTCA